MSARSDEPVRRAAFGPPAQAVSKGAREELAAPIDDTIFFAGEATDSDEAGTVAGALRSGIRAAREART